MKQNKKMEVAKVEEVKLWRLRGQTKFEEVNGFINSKVVFNQYDFEKAKLEQMAVILNSRSKNVYYEVIEA